MVLGTKLVAASANRTVVNAPYAPATVRRLFETANHFNPRNHKVTAIPAWIAGSKKRLDGSVQSKTFVNGMLSLLSLLTDIFAQNRPAVINLI